MKVSKQATSFFGRHFFRGRFFRIVLPLIIGLAPMLFLVGSAAGAGVITRVSTDAAGGQGNAGSFSPSISADGRYVAFYSYASNLVPGDTNGAGDIFVKDTLTGATARVSTDAAGGQGNVGSYNPSISADGRYVAFLSLASNLVPNGAEDIFLAAAPACTGGSQPSLSLSTSNVYWASFADYEARNLSVDYSVGNTGSDTAYAVQVVGSTASNGVTCSTIMPVVLGDIAASGSHSLTLHYTIPNGVPTFTATVYATALDGCGNSYSYPAPYPGS